MITKQKAFEAETTIDALHKIVHSEPIPGTDFVAANVSPELKVIIDKCLQKNPDERFKGIQNIRLN